MVPSSGATINVNCSSPTLTCSTRAAASSDDESCSRSSRSRSKSTPAVRIKASTAALSDSSSSLIAPAENHWQTLGKGRCSATEQTRLLASDPACVRQKQARAENVSGDET
eukprot:scaffold387_cov244-Pinguiococcus_pyrenoidosus.AAC.9